MAVKKLKRSFFQRLLGRPATPLPENNNFWSFNNGIITLDLGQAPKLAKPGGAVRLEGDIPNKLLVVHGEDGQYLAFDNKCTHLGRCIDPVPGTQAVQCCSINASTFDYQGNVIEGPAKSPLAMHPVTIKEGKLVIKIG